VLLTRGAALEVLSHVDTVVFDKTGTLTTGSPEILEVSLNPGRADFTETSARQMAALLELDSSHPVSHAFAMAGIERDRVSDLVSHENGVEGRVAERRYRLGNSAFCSIDEGQLTASTNTRVWLVDEASWIACFELGDSLREDVVEVVAELKQRGLALHILSGDHQAAVQAVAERTHIDHFHAGQSPSMKMAFLDSLQKQGKRVLMVGDGVNDAPVLSVADVSMTVRGASELANSTADFILTSNSMKYIVNIFVSANRTRLIIRQNLAWALSYNLLAVPFAAAGLIVPWMAALGMSLSSLLVVLNSGRLAGKQANAVEIQRPKEAAA
jgi:Cu2+-exporting ATPase